MKALIFPEAIDTGGNIMRAHGGLPLKFELSEVFPYYRSMSAYGPKQTSAVALHMSAFGGKADMTIAECLLLRSLLV